MGVFDRLRRLFRSNLNELIDRAEDPEKVLNQIVADMSTQLLDAKRSVATAIAEEKRLERQVKAQDGSAAEWDRRAVVALGAGKEDLARAALLRKQREQKHADALRTQFEQQHRSVQSLKETLRTLQDRIEEAQRKKTLLVARAKRAEAQKRIQAVSRIPRRWTRLTRWPLASSNSRYKAKRWANSSPTRPIRPSRIRSPLWNSRTVIRCSTTCANGLRSSLPSPAITRSTKTWTR